MTPPDNESASKLWWQFGLGVLSGFGAMALFLVASLSLAYQILEEEGTFQPETFHVTPLWLAAHVAAELIAGSIAGFVAWSVGGKRALYGIVALLFLMGSLTAAGKISEGDHGAPRGPEETDGQMAQTNAISPVWKHLLSPISLAGMALVTGLVASQRSSRDPY